MKHFSLSRRQLLCGLGATACMLTLTRVNAQGQTQQKTYRMLLNTSYSGPQAWFFTAVEQGYLRNAGIEIEFTPGEGAYTAAPRMAAGSYDIGYGDVNSLIEVCAREPQQAPKGVFMMFNNSPSTIAVGTDSVIREPKDLQGATLYGHASDVALRTFGAFCEKVGLDPAQVNIVPYPDYGNFLDGIQKMLSEPGKRGFFGYTSTISAALAEARIDAREKLRFFNYSDYVPQLYGSTLMASQAMLRDNPEDLKAIVSAINQGVAKVVANPEKSIEAVALRNPKMDHYANLLRLQTTLQLEMSNPEGRQIGIGDITPERLNQAIALIARSNNLPRVPKLEDVFTREFLPPLSERVTSLA